MPERPEYKVYRSRPRLLPGCGGDETSLDELRRGGDGRNGGDGRGGVAPARRRRGFRKVSPGRVVAGFLLGVVLWLGIAAVAFVVSSITAPHASASTKAALDAGGPGLTSP